MYKQCILIPILPPYLVAGIMLESSDSLTEEVEPTRETMTCCYLHVVYMPAVLCDCWETDPLVTPALLSLSLWLQARGPLS